LQRLELIEESARGNLTSQAGSREVRRHGEGVDRKAMRFVGLPRQHPNQQHKGGAYNCCKHLQKRLHPIAESSPAEA
jgi:hypothetical protein